MANLNKPADSPDTEREGLELKSAVFQRLKRDGRWPDVEPVRDQMMRAARAGGMSKAEAQAWTYAELDRLYPPLPPNSNADNDLGKAPTSKPGASDLRIQGLGDIPAGWPDLPANASLQAELAWVQAERLRVVEDRGATTIVRLDLAGSPAPSRAALGWLETSIRSYSKYVDVCARSTATAADEQDQVRRERLAIEEIRSLLAEMLPE